MWRFTVLFLVATASAQIPSLGWCPDFQSMANFNMNRFLGTWYEAERFFTVSEIGTRCVTTNYVSTPEGRIIASNEIVSSLTGMKRLMEGSLQMIGRDGEGRFMVKYSSLPLPYESEFSILDTDYENYAVMWSCSGIGPVHTQNTWLLTRERLPSLITMQNAYAVLDRFKISRAFFVKTNQADCTILPDPVAIPIESKSDDEEEGKNLDVVIKAKVVEEPPQKEAVEEVVQERSAEPEIAIEPKPVPVPEMILSENEKKKEEIEESKSSVKAEIADSKVPKEEGSPQTNE